MASHPQNKNELFILRSSVRRIVGATDGKPSACRGRRDIKTTAKDGGRFFICEISVISAIYGQNSGIISSLGHPAWRAFFIVSTAFVIFLSVNSTVTRFFSPWALSGLSIFRRSSMI